MHLESSGGKYFDVSFFFDYNHASVMKQVVYSLRVMIFLYV